MFLFFRLVCCVLYLTSIQISHKIRLCKLEVVKILNLREL